MILSKNILKGNIITIIKKYKKDRKRPIVK